MIETGQSKYFQVGQQLTAEIAHGKFADGLLPAEKDLSEQFGVSRAVIRQALDELERRGLIDRRAGMRTRVNQPEPKADRIVSLTEQIRAAGMTPSTTVRDAGFVPVAEAAEECRVAEALAEAAKADPRLPEVREVFRVDRLRCGDGQPVAEQIIFLIPHQWPAGALEGFDYTQSVFKLYMAHNRLAARADEILVARPANAEEAARLVMRKLPAAERWLMERNRITWDFGGAVLEIMNSRDRVDFFRNGYRYSISGSGGVLG